MTTPDQPGGQWPSSEGNSSWSQPESGGHEAPPIEQSGSFPGPVLDFPSGPVPPGPYPPPPAFGPPPFGPPAYGAPQYPPPPFSPPPPGPPPQFGPPMGYAAPPPYGYPTQPSTNGMAIGAMVTSLASIPFLAVCGIGVLGCIVGIVLGVVALGQLKNNPQNGRGFAITGIAVGAALPVLYFLFMMILFAGSSRHGI